MTIDTYEPCPCGSGKKIKFCCCSDITGELGKVIQKLQGQQRVAALGQIDTLITAHGNRAALMALKATVQIQIGQTENAAETADVFVRDHPENCIALALLSMVEMNRSGALAAIEPLQRALQRTGSTMPEIVYETVSMLAQALLLEGHVLPARAHLMLQGALSRWEDKEAAEILAQINRSPQLPLLLKVSPQFDECAEGAPYKAEFDATLDVATNGRWLAAVERFTALSERAPDDPGIFRNLGILQGCLGNLPEAVAAYRKYASFDDKVDREEAVKAEAVAQLLDSSLEKDSIEVVNVRYPVKDTDALVERFDAETCVTRMPVDPSQFAPEDGPPPKGIYWLLDRPMPQTGVGIELDKVPLVVGNVFLYGRETDREARLEFILSKTHDFDAKTKALTDVAGGLLDQATDSEPVSEIPADEAALSQQWCLPKDTPPEHHVALIDQQRRKMILDRWPACPLAALDGKTPQQVKDDPAYCVRLLAAVWLLEFTGEQQAWDFDYNELRTTLGLPTIPPIDPSGLDVATMPLVHLSRLTADRLSDEQLLLAHRLAIAYSIRKATRSTGLEIIARESLNGNVDKAAVYGALASTTQDSSEAIKWLQDAQATMRQNKQSPAMWLIAELNWRFLRHEARECERLIQEIRSRHMNEPGIGQMLVELLVRFGVISPEGVPAGSPPGSATAMHDMAAAGATTPPSGPGGAAAGGPAANEGLLRPGTPTQKPAGPPAEKPSIWLPGME